MKQIQTTKSGISYQIGEFRRNNPDTVWTLIVLFPNSEKYEFELNEENSEVITVFEITNKAEKELEESEINEVLEHFIN